VVVSDVRFEEILDLDESVARCWHALRACVVKRSGFVWKTTKIFFANKEFLREIFECIRRLQYIASLLDGEAMLWWKIRKQTKQLPLLDGEAMLWWKKTNMSWRMADLPRDFFLYSLLDFEAYLLKFSYSHDFYLIFHNIIYLHKHATICRSYRSLFWGSIEHYTGLLFSNKTIANDTI